MYSILYIHYKPFFGIYKCGGEKKRKNYCGEQTISQTGEINIAILFHYKKSGDMQCALPV